MSEVGRVLGTDDARPLDFWVAVAEGHYLQLDDVVLVETPLPDGNRVTIYGVVDQVRARYEGARFDSDVFRAAAGVLPVGIVCAAHVAVTRVEPEIFVPPLPGQPVCRAEGIQREEALYFDRMDHRFPAGLGRDGQVVWGNLEFLDGTRGGHINIAGVSGVATKTSYALFLLYGLFHHPQAAERTRHARAVIFNVKGEDLLFLDKPNARLDDEQRRRYECLGLPAGPFRDVALWAPPVRHGFGELVPSTVSRQQGVTPYAWSLREFCQRRLLSFLFADGDGEHSQLPLAIGAAERYLQQETEGQPASQSWVMLGGRRVTDFQDLVDFLQDHRDEVFGAARVSTGTVDALLRRLQGSVDAVGHLVRGDLSPDQQERHRIEVRARQLNVIDIHALHDRAKRFVVGVVLRQLLQEKDEQGTREPLLFVVLDELNKYAPREGWSPIKEVVLDIAERGRSLGVILIGAQQTASEVERRVVTNASFRVTGRLDTAEAERSEYGFLGPSGRARASILKPGSMFLHQPELPVPLLVQFPFPAWATRPEEVATEDPWSRVRG
jgi:DNA helicase HerA-like ATPase